MYRIFVSMNLNRSMETKSKKRSKSAEKQGKSATTQQQNSKIAAFWEKYPDGIGEIIDMRAVLR
jgi:hypothetical protein